jgi:hypothetical protein
MNAAVTTNGLLAGAVRHGDRPTILTTFKRADLPAFTRWMGFTRGAEVGVWRGAFSAHFCVENPDLHMLCVDPWISYPEWNDPKNLPPLPKSEALIAGAYQEAQARLGPLNCTIARAFSVDAAATVPDASLDFVYIDGNHVYDAVMADLQAWAPKVRSGGFVAGHDYRVFPNKPMIQVKAAVDDYTRQHGIDPWYLLAGERTPSFLWVVS